MINGMVRNGMVKIRNLHVSAVTLFRENFIIFNLRHQIYLQHKRVMNTTIGMILFPGVTGK